MSGTDRARMKLPPIHPGEHVREYMQTCGLTVTELAKRLKVTRPNVSNMLNGKAGISAPMALKLERVFSRPALFWMALQMNYELNCARRAKARTARG